MRLRVLFVSTALLAGIGAYAPVRELIVPQEAPSASVVTVQNPQNNPAAETVPAAPSPVEEPVHAAPRRLLPLPRPLLAAVNQEDILPAHRVLADSVLRTLTPHCRTYLKNFHIRYDHPERRGLGGKTTIIVDGSVPDAELAALLVHECAHVIHANMTGTATSGPSAFRDGESVFYADAPMVAFFRISWQSERVLNPAATDADFASGYASSNAFEDFAETYALYVLHRDAFVARSATNSALAAKLAWMQRYLPLPQDALGKSGYVPDSTVPWDVTRLPLALTLEETVAAR